MFVVHCLDKSTAAGLRVEHRPVHLEYVKSTRKALVGAGPLFSAEGSPIGGLFVLALDSLVEAAEWARNDPFNELGVYETVSIHSWKYLQGTGIEPKS
ncbi:YciI family protein (plasmid) [Agrobacterium leguminum]|uniref:YciI family protein n=1 Tax=Agrobacterium leguminum TaxID=2792015 RepID=UPI0030CAD88E